MPTKIYSSNAEGHISYNGKIYEIAKDGSVDVPDDAVDVFVESHGFSLNKIDKNAPKPKNRSDILETDVTGFTAPELKEFAKEHLGLEFAPRTGKPDILEAVQEEIARRKDLAA
jgi:hypothetical protein